MPEITLALLSERVDLASRERLVHSSINAGLGDAESLLRFLFRYTAWNGWFGAGVSSLAAKIARCRRLFLDPEIPIPSVADRSVLIASYIFDAARDEFDDRNVEARATHRCLAQNLVVQVYSALLGVEGESLVEPDWLEKMMDCPLAGAGRRARESSGLPLPTPV